MKIEFIEATEKDSEHIAQLVLKLTSEICKLTKTQHFDITLSETTQRCQKLLKEGHYAAIIGFYGNKPIAVATFAETYALYAGGKIGLIQEFYISPEHRTSGLGRILLDRVRAYGLQQNWSCIELCTPPLPEFERTLNFYKKNGLSPVGGRKMRQTLI
ncbi:GNAT family N-acetyltransferase [Pseudoalteromonas denitrificans]|nr:GNAT family N-acetyltransferase [Pseudoalteromonas denitrificans]